jgi:MinD superfamily P-loop ATPase
VATSLALALQDRYPVQFLDCDVEEPDAHILLKPKITEREPVYVKRPKIDERKCDYCGKCSEACQFNAIMVLKGKLALVYPMNSATAAASAIWSVPRMPSLNTMWS